MLVLTRSVGESLIVIGDIQIRVTVCAIRQGKVRVGIDAPGLRIVREEILSREDPKGGGVECLS